MRKVRIKGLPKKAHGGPTGGATDGIRRFMEGNKNYDRGMNQFAAPEFEVNRSISAVDPSEANIEAEGGEYAVVPGMAGIPESYKINGPRHNAGGVPLNLAEDSFIYSDFRDMKIKDKEILKEFGVSVPKKGRVKGKTPAELAKKYDLNKYKKILLDPNSDMLERETAEAMIKNFNMKLGKLALVQESKKGFPQEVPAVAIPYLQSIGQDPQQFAEQPEQEQPMQAAYGAGVTGDPSQYAYAYGGENRKMANRFPGLDVKQRGGQFTGAFWDSILQEGGDMSYAQDGLTVEERAKQQATYDYLKQNNFSGTNITVGDKEKDLLHKRYKEVMSPIKLKGKDFDKPYMGTKRIPTDSIANVPGGLPVHWSKSGKPTVVGKDAKAFNENYAKYYSKGISNVEYFPSFNAPEEQISITPSPYEQKVGGTILKYQIGGNNDNINEDEYQTAADYAADQMQFVEPDVWNREIGGTKRSRKRLQAKYLFDMIKDAEAAGLDENEYKTIIDQEADAVGLDEEDYINDIISGLTAEELKELKQNKFIVKKIKKATTTATQTVGDKAKVSSKPTYKIPTGATVHEEDDNYKESNVKKGDYVRRKDGKVYKATGKTFEDFEYDQLDKIHENSRDSWSRSYALLNKTLTDPKNKEMTDALYENYKKNIEASSKLTKDRKIQLKKLSKEDMLKNLMKAQEHVYALSAAAKEDPELAKRLDSKSMGNSKVMDPVTKKYYKKNEAYKEILTELGYAPEDALGDDMIAAFQGSFQGLQQLSKDPKWADNLKDFDLKPVGVSDEEWAETTNISEADEYFGNTTSGQGARANANKMGFEEAEIATDPSVVAKADDPTYDQTSTDAPWWAQDTGNMLMTLGERASIKKYLPHSFPVDLARPDVVYYDPSRALAASAEQANIAAQAASAFAGPQSTYQLTGIQGQGFQQAANTLADYEAKNVGLANQYLDKVKSTADRENLMNAQRMKQFFDETTVADQQFDNAKRAANRNVFDAWRQGLTNATKTQTMNMLYPQYNVDPRAGGITHFTEGRPQTKDPTSSSGYAKGYKQFIKDTGLPNDARSYDQYRKQQGLGSPRRRSQRPQGDQFMADYSGMGFNPYPPEQYNIN